MGKIYKNGIPYSGGGSSGGTSDYTELSNKPQVNGTTLSGNKTSAQLGLVDEDVVTDAYDGTETYHTGDYCIYSGELYKCNGTTTGDWDSTKWDNVKITDLVSDAKPTWGSF